MSMTLRRLMQLPDGTPIPAGCEIGMFTVSEASATATVQHSLGTVPRIATVIGVLSEAYGEYSLPANTAPLLGEMLMSDPEDGTFDTSKTTGHVVNNLWSLNMSDQKATQATTTYSTYPASMTSNSVTFATGRYYNARFLPEDKYIYILIK